MASRRRDFSTVVHPDLVAEEQHKLRLRGCVVSGCRTGGLASRGESPVIEIFVRRRHVRKVLLRTFQPLRNSSNNAANHFEYKLECQVETICSM